MSKDRKNFVSLIPKFENIKNKSNQDIIMHSIPTITPKDNIIPKKLTEQPEIK
jgi:hypothetical protein